VYRSWGWKVRSARSLHFDKKEVDEARELISAREGLGTPWGWKDPRTLLLAEEWKSQIPQLQALVLWRSGANVIESLIARSNKDARWPGMKIGYTEACLVSRAYSILLLRYVRQHSKDVFGCSIEDLVRSDGRKLIDATENHCEIRLARLSFQDAFDARMMNQRKPSMRSNLLFRLSGGQRLNRELTKLVPPIL
jgi:hypothetical protein